jgi:zinc/manganese transport system permease protein
MNAASVLQLMLPSFCLCVLMVGMLSYLGIHVIKREIIFVDLALAQIAALGALLGFLLGIPLHTQASFWFSVALTAIAAAVFTLSRTRESRVPQEAVIGLVYAIAAAAAIILIDKAPHGAEHIKDILTGSILWVKWPTVRAVALVYLVIGIFHFVFRRPFLLISDDPEAARANGLSVGLWDFLFYLSFGFVITVSVGSAGVLLVFVFLVAPAVMAVLITDRLVYQLLLGWALGVLATITGLVVSYIADLSSGPLVIVAYAVALVAVSAILFNVRASNRAKALKQTGAIALAFALCLALLVGVGRAVGARLKGALHGHAHTAAVEPGHTDAEARDDAPGTHTSGEVSPEDLPAVLAETRDVARVADLFDQFPEPQARADVVLRSLELDTAAGAALALRFLAEEPPLFFAETVVNQLDAHLPNPSGFDVSQPFDAPVNQEAAARITSALGLGR